MAWFCYYGPMSKSRYSNTTVSVTEILAETTVGFVNIYLQKANIEKFFLLRVFNFKLPNISPYFHLNCNHKMRSSLLALNT